MTPERADRHRTAIEEDPRTKPARRRRLATVCVAASVVAVLAGCSSTSLAKTTSTSGSAAPAIAMLGAEHDAQPAVAASPSTLSFVYTGHVETVVVPQHVGFARIAISGGQGANQRAKSSVYKDAGYGATIHGLLPVSAGDTLTLAVGGWGAESNGASVGGGGWSIAPYAGGKGGTRNGSQATAGSGGGGASVIEVNGKVEVVAAGGGGEGGAATHGGVWFQGGNAGAGAGGGGIESSQAGGTAGFGGSKSRPSLNPNATDFSGNLLKGGGGGGGGGYYPGGGAHPSTWGGGGGGGGASFTGTVVNPTWDVDGKCGFWSCNAVGNQGHGSMSLTWLPPDDTEQDYTFQKTDAANTQLLEVSGDKPDDGTPVDTWHRTVPAGSTIPQPNQVWTYKFDGRLGAGHLQNKSTGKCLEVNESNAKIDQWTCVDQPNELWKLVSNPGGTTALQIDMPEDETSAVAKGTYFLAASVDSVAVVDGTPLELTQAQGERTAWDSHSLS